MLSTRTRDFLTRYWIMRVVCVLALILAPALLIGCAAASPPETKQSAPPAAAQPTTAPAAAAKPATAPTTAPAAAAKPATAPTTAPAAAAKPSTGAADMAPPEQQVIRTAVYADWFMDPAAHGGQAARTFNTVYRPLTHVDGEGNLVPGVASKWEAKDTVQRTRVTPGRRPKSLRFPMA